MRKISNYINGRLVASNSGEYLDNYDPAVGEVYSLTPDSGVQDVDTAVLAAESAFSSWSSTQAAERAAVMNKIADLIDRNLDPLAQAESRDNGKPLTLARTVEIPRASSNFRFFASAITHPIHSRARSWAIE